MNLKNKLTNLVLTIHANLFPTEHDKEVKRWFNDGGDEKFRFDYNLNSDSLVLDFGGYKGQWTSDIYSRFNCRILVFEPIKSFASNIKERFKHNEKIEVYSFALGKNCRQDLISLDNNSTSLYINSATKEEIQFEDVFEFFVNKNIQNVDLMKINIEGGEYELLTRMLDTGLIERIKNIQVQFHNFKSEDKVLMDKICLELSKTHIPTFQYKFVWENWVRLNLSNSI